MNLNTSTIPLFQKELLAWYTANCRSLPWRASADPYHVWVSEVMLQQTQVRTALPYFLEFINRFPTITDFAAADLETVLKLWEGLGYYARARNFHAAARQVATQYSGRIPDSLEAFIRLPGVGDYIGAAVQSIAFGHPHAVVDGNVKRVLARLYCLDYPVNQASAHKKFSTCAQTLLYQPDPGSFNQAVMELGALVCTPQKMHCDICPVSRFCKGFLSGTASCFPRRIKAPKIPLYHVAAGIVVADDRILITRRKLNGLLGGLWEFPGGKQQPGETAETACIREIKEETGLVVGIDSHLTTIAHSYTHFKIRLAVFYCHPICGSVTLKDAIDHRWIRVDEIDRFAFPRANTKFIPLIKIPEKFQPETS